MTPFSTYFLHRAVSGFAPSKSSSWRLPTWSTELVFNVPAKTWERSGCEGHHVLYHTHTSWSRKNISLGRTFFREKKSVLLNPSLREMLRDVFLRTRALNLGWNLTLHCSFKSAFYFDWVDHFSHFLLGSTFLVTFSNIAQLLSFKCQNEMHLFFSKAVLHIATRFLNW